VQHLKPEDKDFLLFLMSLKDDEFTMLLNSMSAEDCMKVAVMIQEAKDEFYDEIMEAEGMPEAFEITKRIKAKLNET
jgi:phage antirepressor YoqD-like protein